MKPGYTHGNFWQATNYISSQHLTEHHPAKVHVFVSFCFSVTDMSEVKIECSLHEL